MSTRTTLLIPGYTLTFAADVAGTLERLQNQDGATGGTLNSETVAASGSVTVGPFATQTRWQYPSTWTTTINTEPSGYPSSGGTHSYVTPADGTHNIPRHVVAIFDDFTEQTLAETDGPWILNSGTDVQAIDPAINVQAGGVVRLTSGDAGTGVAADGSQLVCHIPMTASKGGLVFEARLNIDTAVTTVQVVAGFTDVTTLELPASVGASDTITTTFSDGCAFVYDTGADTDQWFAVGVAGDTDATGNGATGIVPVADTYQVLRIEIDDDGATARFYINGTLVKSLTASAVTAATSIYATVVVNATTTTSRSVDVDYIYVAHNR